MKPMKIGDKIQILCPMCNNAYVKAEVIDSGTTDFKGNQTTELRVLPCDDCQKVKFIKLNIGETENDQQS